jgi:putative DNA primase/helicase
MVGSKNVVAPSLAQFGQPFGLQPLIGATLAVISDARLTGVLNSGLIAENLLRITSGEPVTVDRKHSPSWTGVLRTRIVLIANELPRIPDVSGALPSRFVIVQLQKSFLGAEDTDLLPRLLTELPGILHWSLDGLDDLRASGRFTEPASSQQVKQELRDLGSPIGAFLRERTVLDPVDQVAVADLYAAWCAWCEDRGIAHPGDEQQFGRGLRAVYAHVELGRPRDRSAAGGRLRVYKGLRLRGPNE